MPSSADAIRERMKLVRHEISDDVDEIVESTRDMTDWRSYVKRYPWVCLGVAVAAGIFVVPKRVSLIAPDADTLLKLAKRKKLVVEPKPKAKAKSGVSGALLSLMTNAALRGGMAYAGQMLGKTSGETAGDAAKQGTRV